MTKDIKKVVEREADSTRSLPAAPEQGRVTVSRAAEQAREVFAASCNHTSEAIDYMEQLLLAAFEASPTDEVARLTAERDALKAEVERLTENTNRFPALMASILEAKGEDLDSRVSKLIAAMKALPWDFHRYQWEADAKPAFGEKFVRSVAGNDGMGMGRQWIATTPSHIDGLAAYIAAANPDTIAMLLAERDEMQAELSRALTQIASLDAECDRRHQTAQDALAERDAAIARADALKAEVARLRNALMDAASNLDDYSPLTGNTIETPASKAARASLAQEGE